MPLVERIRKKKRMMNKLRLSLSGSLICISIVGIVFGHSMLYDSISALLGFILSYYTIRKSPILGA